MGVSRFKTSKWYEDAIKIIVPAISGMGTVRVLEAGGGADRFVALPNSIYTVLDISPDQLEQNEYADVKLLGDVQTFDYGDKKFDLIIFWDVLEHVAQPLAAVKLSAAALEQNGFIAIKGPLLSSTKSIVTSLTPWWFHVLYYRHVLGSDMAGQPGHAPFKTEHASGANLSDLINFARTSGFEIVASKEYVSDQIDALKRKSTLAYWLYSFVGATIRLLSAQKYGSRETDFLLVIRRA